MPGSNIVNANIIIWQKAVTEQCKFVMDTHMRKNHLWAISNAPYDDDTGISRNDLYRRTSASGMKIESEIGYMSHPRTGMGSKGWWLENPNNSVGVYRGVAYGGKPFGGKYRILEKAVIRNISSLIAQLRAVMHGSGSAFAGIRFIGQRHV